MAGEYRVLTRKVDVYLYDYYVFEFVGAPVWSFRRLEDTRASTPEEAVSLYKRVTKINNELT